MYQNFVPQDSVQQYVSQYTGHPYAPNGGDPYAGPTGYSMAANGPGPYGGIPFGPAFPPGGPGFPPGGPGFPPGGPGFPPVGPGAFSVQSGYEGFLVPSIVAPPPPPPPLFSALRSILPRSLMSLFMRSGDYIVRSLSFLFFGGIFTTAVCSMTPLCTITFPLLALLRFPTSATTLLQKTLGTEITTDRVARAAEFVGTALMKYQQLQAEQKNDNEAQSTKETTQKSSEDTADVPN